MYTTVKANASESRLRKLSKLLEWGYKKSVDKWWKELKLTVAGSSAAPARAGQPYNLSTLNKLWPPTPLLLLS